MDAVNAAIKPDEFAASGMEWDELLSALWTRTMRATPNGHSAVLTFEPASRMRRGRSIMRHQDHLQHADVLKHPTSCVFEGTREFCRCLAGSSCDIVFVCLVSHVENYQTT